MYQCDKCHEYFDITDMAIIDHHGWNCCDRCYKHHYPAGVYVPDMSTTAQSNDDLLKWEGPYRIHSTGGDE